MAANPVSMPPNSSHLTSRLPCRSNVRIWRVFLSSEWYNPATDMSIHSNTWNWGANPFHPYKFAINACASTPAKFGKQITPRFGLGIVYCIASSVQCSTQRQKGSGRSGEPFIVPLNRRSVSSNLCSWWNSNACSAALTMFFVFFWLKQNRRIHRSSCFCETNEECFFDDSLDLVNRFTVLHTEIFHRLTNITFIDWIDRISNRHGDVLSTKAQPE